MAQLTAFPKRYVTLVTCDAPGCTNNLPIFDATDDDPRLIDMMRDAGWTFTPNVANPTPQQGTCTCPDHDAPHASIHLL